MRRFIIAAILAAGPAIAAESMIARAGENSLRLHDKPCTEATVNKESFKACWISQDEQVWVLYSDGDRSVIPLSAFKPDGV